MEIRIVKVGINGEGIGYLNRKPVFIPGCFPGETVDFDIIREEKGYIIGSLKRIIRYVREHQRSNCPYSRSCGGCAFRGLDYASQLKYKKQLLREAMVKYCGYRGKIDDTVASPVTDSYRNKINMPFITRKGRLANAMYKPGSNEPVLIENCLLHDPKLEKTRIAVLEVLNRHHLRSYDLKTRTGLRQLVIRGFEKIQILLITGNDDIPEKAVSDLMNIDDVISVYQGINTSKNPVRMIPGELKLLMGEETIPLKYDDYKLLLRPDSFFQLNYAQAENIYKAVKKAVPVNNQLIVEAYCGIGAMSVSLSDKSAKVIGIDNEPSSIKDARELADLNGLNNVEFICGDATEELIKLLENHRIDTLVVDPPRSGIDDRLVKQLKKSGIETIIYVSCNPATLAKNLNVLQENYSIEKVRPYDMFPNTPLIETLVILKNNAE